MCNDRQIYKYNNVRQTYLLCICLDNKIRYLNKKLFSIWEFIAPSQTHKGSNDVAAADVAPSHTHKGSNDVAATDMAPSHTHKESIYVAATDMAPSHTHKWSIDVAATDIAPSHTHKGVSMQQQQI